MLQLLRAQTHDLNVQEIRYVILCERMGQYYHLESIMCI